MGPRAADELAALCSCSDQVGLNVGFKTEQEKHNSFCCRGKELEGQICSCYHFYLLGAGNMHAAQYTISKQFIKQRMVYLLVYLFSVCYFSKHSLCKMADTSGPRFLLEGPAAGSKSLERPSRISAQHRCWQESSRVFFCWSEKSFPPEKLGSLRPPGCFSCCCWRCWMELPLNQGALSSGARS